MSDADHDCGGKFYAICSKCDKMYEDGGYPGSLCNKCRPTTVTPVAKLCTFRIGKKNGG